MAIHKSVTAKEAVDAIEGIMGKALGRRRAHAVGLGLDATFQPTGAARLFTTAAHLQKEKVQAIVRFSHSSPSSDPHEWLNPVKGMAVQFQLPDGPETNVVMANIPVFVSKTPEEFIRLLQVFQGGEMTMREKLETLRGSVKYKAIAQSLKHLTPVIQFETERYYAIHAFFAVNEDEIRTPVKFEWEPMNDKKFPSSKSFEHSLLDHMKEDTIRFRLIMQIGTKEDPSDDSTIMWPKDRLKVEAGILTLEQRRADNAESIVFDPTVLPKGLECSDDPVLQFRSSAYAESAKRRHSE